MKVTTAAGSWETSFYVPRLNSPKWQLQSWHGMALIQICEVDFMTSNNLSLKDIVSRRKIVIHCTQIVRRVSALLLLGLSLLR